VSALWKGFRILGANPGYESKGRMIMNLHQEYCDRLFLEIDNALRESFAVIGVSLEEIKEQPHRFLHLIFPDGRQEYRWDGKILVWLEKMKLPKYGFNICHIRKKHG